MSARLTHADSIPGRPLRAPVKTLLLLMALGMAVSLRAQSADQSDEQPAEPGGDQSADQPVAGTYSLLYSFQCGSDASTPETGLVRDSSGNLYGTTIYGGQYDYGTVFKLTPDGTETVLHSFAGAPSDGDNAFAGGITLDATGNIYGTTYAGGEFNSGTAFKVTTAGAESVLYSFTGGSDGNQPFGGVARDSAGNLYGTTYAGGTYGAGVVFKLTSGGSESVLYNFGNSSTDVAFPFGHLTRDSSGNLYGTTSAGGASDAGMVFKVTASDTESVLHSFEGYPVDGAGPYGGGLLRDTSGNLYGVTEYGGADGDGVVFKLTSGGTESVLLNFTGGAGGGFPIDILVRDAAGNLYVTASAGGSGAGCPDEGCGVLFRLTTVGKEIVLHDFALSSSSDGAYPDGGVVRDPSGNLYGTLFIWRRPRLRRRVQVHAVSLLGDRMIGPSHCGSSCSVVHLRPCQ